MTSRPSHCPGRTDPGGNLSSDELARTLVENLPALNSLDDTAAFFGRTTRTMRSWVSRGLMRVIRPCGGNPMVPRGEIERVLREGAK